MPAEGNRLAGPVVLWARWPGSAADELVTLFACGDVMPGRGIDQILPYPGDPELREDYASDANAYVGLAIRGNGPIPRPAGLSWPWSDARPVIEDAAPDVWVINPGDERHPQRGLRPRQGRALPDEPGQPAVRGRDQTGRLPPGQQSRARLRRPRAPETLAALTMVPMQARNMRLRHANAADSRWLAATPGHLSREFGSRVEHRPGGRLIVPPLGRLQLPFPRPAAQRAAHARRRPPPGSRRGGLAPAGPGLPGLPGPPVRPARSAGRRRTAAR